METMNSNLKTEIELEKLKDAYDELDREHGKALELVGKYTIDILRFMETVGELKPWESESDLFPRSETWLQERRDAEIKYKGLQVKFEMCLGQKASLDTQVNELLELAGNRENKIVSLNKELADLTHEFGIRVEGVKRLQEENALLQKKLPTRKRLLSAIRWAWNDMFGYDDEYRFKHIADSIMNLLKPQK